MFCGKCGALIDDNSIFCPECGSKVKDCTSGDDGSDETTSIDAINVNDVTTSMDSIDDDDETMSIDAVKVEDDFNEETDILKPIVEKDISGIDVTDNMPPISQEDTTSWQQNVAAFSAQSQIPQACQPQSDNVAAASAKTNKTPIIIGASIAGVLLIVLLLWLFVFGGLSMFGGKTAIGDQLKSSLLNDTDFTTKVVKDKFTFKSDPSIKHLDIKEDRVEDKGSDWEKHYVEFSGEAENNYYKSNFSGSTTYIKRGDDITINDSDSNFAVDSIEPTRAPDSVTEEADIKADDGDLIDDDGNLKAIVKGDESVKDYWFGQEVHKVEVTLLFDKDKGWMVQDRHAIEGSKKMRVDLNDKKFKYSADLMDSKTSHESMNRYFMIVHSECIPEMELTFDSVDDDGNAKAKLTIKQESKEANEQDVKATCFTTLHSDHDSNSITFDKIDASVDLTGKFSFGTNSGVTFTASGTPTGTFTTVDGSSANLSFEVTESNETSARFKLVSNLRYHTTKSLYRQFFFDKLKFEKVQDENKDDSKGTSLKQDTSQVTSGEFSWIQDYDGRTYVGANGLSNYAMTITSEDLNKLGNNYEKLPVYSDSFRIIDDKIYYVVPHCGEGRNATKLMKCNLDGSSSEVLADDVSCVLGLNTVYSEGSIYYVKEPDYMTVSSTDQNVLGSYNIKTKETNSVELSKDEQLLGASDGAVYTCKTISSEPSMTNPMGGYTLQIIKRSASLESSDVIKELGYMSLSTGAYNALCVKGSKIFVQYSDSSAGSKLFVYSLDGNEIKNFAIGSQENTSGTRLIATDDQQTIAFCEAFESGDLTLHFVNLDSLEVSSKKCSTFEYSGTDYYGSGKNTYTVINNNSKIVKISSGEYAIEGGSWGRLYNFELIDIASGEVQSLQAEDKDARPERYR